MSDTKVTEILKKAMLLERQGMNFYGKVASQTESDAVKNIFSIMAGEEKKHYEALKEQYRNYENEGKFTLKGALGSPDDITDKVLTDKVKEDINAANFEAASISAAIGMEREAIALYSERAGQTEDPDEKKIYDELAKWEQTHVTFLNKIYNDLLEDSWYDANFWPS